MAKPDFRSTFLEQYKTFDADTQAAVDGYLKSASNYAEANKMNGITRRLFDEEVYKNALTLAQGDLQLAGYPSQATKNIFNGYSKKETKQVADEVMQDYFNLNDNNLTRSPYLRLSQSTSTSIPKNKYYQYVWNLNYDPNWSTVPNTLKLRLSEYINILLGSLNDTKTYLNDGYTINGFPGINNERLTDLISKLSSLKSKITDNEETNKSLLSELAALAQVSRADADFFKNYFGDYMKVSEEDTAKNKLASEGFTPTDLNGVNQNLKNLADTNGYHIYTDKDGQIVLLDQNYNRLLLENPYVYIGSDYTKPDYDKGYMIDETGRYIDTDSIDEQNPLYSYKEDYINSIKAQRDPLFHASSDAWDDIYSRSEYDIINKFSRYINGKKFANVGNLFNSNTPVIAVPKTGSDFKYDRFGNIILNNDVIFYFIDENGKYKYTDKFDVMKNIMGGFRISGYDEVVDPYGDIDNSLIGILDQTQNTISYDEKVPHIMPNGEINGKFRISENPLEFTKIILNSINSVGKNNTSNKLLARFNYNENPEKLAKFLQEIITVNKYWDKLSYSQQKAYRLLFDRAKRKMSVNTTMLKNGGVIKAAKGTTITNDKKQSAEFDYNNKIQYSDDIVAEMNRRDMPEYNVVAGKRIVSDDIKASDALRFATMAQDVAGVVMSLTGLNAASAGLGVTAMGTDLAADIMDESVTKGQVLKNALMNAGFAAVSWIPGANLGKVTRNLVKYAPKIIAAAGAAQIALNDDIRKSWDKVMGQKEKLTVDDWKNIGYTLSAVAGLTRLGRGAYDNRKGKAKFKTVVNGKNAQLQIRDGSTVTIDQSTKNEVNNLLKSGKVDDAYKILSNKTGKTREQLGEDILNIKFRPNRAKAVGEDGKVKTSYQMNQVELKSKDVDAIDYNRAAQIFADGDEQMEKFANKNIWNRFQVFLANSRLGNGAYTPEQNYMRQHFNNSDDFRNFANFTRKRKHNVLELRDYLDTKASAMPVEPTVDVEAPVIRVVPTSSVDSTPTATPSRVKSGTNWGERKKTIENIRFLENIFGPIPESIKNQFAKRNYSVDRMDEILRFLNRNKSPKVAPTSAPTPTPTEL